MSDVEFTGNESLEELEAKLDQLEREEDESIVDDPVPGGQPAPAAAPAATQTGDNAQQTVTTTTAEVTPPAGNDGSSAQQPTPGEGDKPGEGAKPVILAKDGVHTIPYDVLEATRERARQAEERAQKLADDAAKAAQLELELSALKQRAVDAGVDTSILDGSGMNADQLKELMEEYPALGRQLQAMSQQISALTASTPAAAQDSAPVGTSVVDVALMQLPELDGWRTGDQDRWDMALAIDARLQKDPDFAGKSLVQRFGEVQHRVKAAFGDSPAQQEQVAIAAQAAEKVAAAAATLPGSPSDVGSTAAAQPTNKAAQIAAQSGNALLHSMNGMSDAEIEALLSTFDY
ncbi:hypothetical protein [Klebsiella pasteurii]|uniref:hypothetical protein n=1 Tax=Klebsiella pasteurii TaxID=2587529 RepID=UPI0035CED21E